MCSREERKYKQIVTNENIQLSVSSFISVSIEVNYTVYSGLEFMSTTPKILGSRQFFFTVFFSGRQHFFADGDFFTVFFTISVLAGKYFFPRPTNFLYGFFLPNLSTDFIFLPVRLRRKNILIRKVLWSWWISSDRDQSSSWLFLLPEFLVMIISRGVKKTQKFEFELAPKHIPFLLAILSYIQGL